jgi:hypothetical protein
MNPARLQYMQLQLMQQYALQQQTSSATDFQKSLVQLATQSDSSLRESIKDAEVLTRLSAASVTGEKRAPLQADLIGLLTDKNDAVRQVARLSLIKLSMTAPPPKAAKASAVDVPGNGFRTAADCQSGRPSESGTSMATVVGQEKMSHSHRSDAEQASGSTSVQLVHSIS